MLALETKRISKRFGEGYAVQDLSIELPEGHFLSLLGPSGCGKTTTLRMIAGFLAPTSGGVFIRGKDVTHRPAYLRNIGLVFQNYALFPHMTVAENVAFGLQMRGVERHMIDARIKQSLALTQLQSLGDRYPHQLSGGQQQRVALARALVIEPDLLLLDEPLSNLDATLRASMRIEIKALQRKLGISTIYVTHDQVEAQVMSDSVVVLNKGQQVQAGHPRQLYDQPRNRFIAEFMGDANILDGQIINSDGRHLDVVLKNGERIQVSDSRRLPNGQIELCVRPEKVNIAKASVRDVNSIKGTVEEIVHMGAITRRLVRSSGMLLKVDCMGGKDERAETGDTVFVVWHPDDVVALVKSD